MPQPIRSGAARALALVLTLAVAGRTVAAQDESPRRSLDIGVNNTGLSIGDSERWRGVRLNFRDTRLERADGVNLTLWSPTEDGAG